MKSLLSLLFALAVVASFGISPAAADDGCQASNYPGCGGCQCEACVCAMDSFCCSIAWDSICVQECIYDCGGCGPAGPCGNGTCEPNEDEDCASCPEDCGCNAGQVCFENDCCSPGCGSKECGDDGCGGSCGDCPGGTCFDGTCCFPQCDGKECGDDGCGGSCGDCPPYDTCVDGACIICEPDCTGKECGSDECGGSCGECPFGQFCTPGFQCQDLPTCQPIGDIGCEETLYGSTASGENLFQAYNCGSGLKKGNEVSFAFVAEVDDKLTFTLDELNGTGSLSLLLLGDPCIEEHCLATDKGTLVADVVAGETYFVLVDGPVGPVVDFKLSLACLSECETQCAGKECGPDGCGGLCGECPTAEICANGQCVTYGGFGWPCVGDYECSSGFCVQGPAGTVCSMLCDDDPCPDGWSCETVDGESVCVSDCQPDCTDQECGDNGCGFPCGQCAAGWTCEEGLCVEAPCEPQCDGKDCGPDGCGASCGECEEGYECVAQVCEPLPCDPDCTGIECGPSNCPGMSCGECEEGLVCMDGTCQEPPCEPACDGLECGDDGCGGSCGECDPWATCTDGICVGDPTEYVEDAPDALIADGNRSGDSEVIQAGDAGGSSGGSDGGSCSTTGNPASTLPLFALLALLALLTTISRRRRV